jgi:hypothetical protein
MCEGIFEAINKEEMEGKVVPTSQPTSRPTSHPTSQPTTHPLVLTAQQENCSFNMKSNLTETLIPHYMTVH